MDGQVPREVVQERYERLVALQDRISWEENKKQVGRVVELLVAEGEGRKDGATHRLSGRARDNRLVHFTPPGDGTTGDGYAADGAAGGGPGPSAEGASIGRRGRLDRDGPIRPGDMVTVEITYAAPHHLVADGQVLSVRRTRAGDAWAARKEVQTSSSGPSPVSLGIPTVGVPGSATPEPAACR
jgi:tRNA-2-methylthio-N6-dimethylallyladenosine synthase